MPDGNGSLKTPQQEAGREGIVARASEKLQKFREAIQALFRKEGSDKVNKKDKSKVDEILAIAEADVARVQKESEPLEKILEEARAGLTEVTFKEDLSGAVEGLKKKQKEAVEKALREYREALVEVLKEGEKSQIVKREDEPTRAHIEAAPQAADSVVGEGSEGHDKKVKRLPRSKKRDNEREAWMDDIDAHFTRDFRADEDLLSAVLEYKKPNKHIKEYEALIDLASQAYTALNKLRAYEGRVDEKLDLKNFEAYEASIKAVESAAAAYVALDGETPASVDSTTSTSVPGERVEGGLSDEELIEAVMDAPNPKREDLVGPFQRMMLLATRADALSRRVKTDESQRAEYVQKIGELRTAREMYRALERVEPPVGGQVQAEEEEEEEARPVIPRGAPVADIADLAKMLRRNPNTKKAPQAPDASLSRGVSGPINVPTEVAERLRAEKDARAQERGERESKDVVRLIEKLKTDKKREVMARIATFKGDAANQEAVEKLIDADLRVQVARWLVEFMDGQSKMVRLPASEAWEERTNDKGETMKAMAANESEPDEYAKAVVMESRYALSAVVTAGKVFGFQDEKEIRSVALDVLPSEQKGGLGSFVRDATKALEKDRQRKELEEATREIELINAKLGKHRAKLTVLAEDEVQALQARHDGLLELRKQLMEDLTGNSFKDKASNAQKEAQVTPEAIKTKVEKFIGSPSSLGKEEAGWKNQDTFLVDHENGFFGVFDGIGGSAAGDRASQLVRDYVQSRVKEFEGLDAEAVAQVMADMMNKCAQELRAAEQADPALEGMGTTVTLIKIVGNEVVIGQAGDSRVYGRRVDGKLRSLTLDSNKAMDKVRADFDDDVAFVFQQVVDELDKAGDWTVFKQKTNEELKALDFSEEEIKIFRERQGDFESLVPDYFLRRNVISAEAGSGGHVDIYDLDGEKELLLTSDGIHDNLKKSEIRLILTGQYDKLEDTELRDGLKGITNPTEALTTAAQIRSKQKGNIRAKPDDMTALRVEREMAHADDPLVEISGDDAAPALATPDTAPNPADPGADASAPDAPPLASPEAVKVNVEQVDLKNQTEAARAQLEEIKASISSWDTKSNLIHDDKLIKEAVKRFEEIVAHDEAFLANGDVDGAYQDKRNRLTKGGYLERLKERIFEVISKDEPVYAEQFSAWITKEKERPEAERNSAWIQQLEKRQQAVQALKPLFEAFLTSPSKPTPDAKPAPTPDTPPTPDTTPATDPFAAPSSADAISPTPDVKTSAPTPDAAAPIPPAAPPSTPDAIPPAPPAPPDREEWPGSSCGSSVPDVPDRVRRFVPPTGSNARVSPGFHGTARLARP
jgi:serine/threonine protein phosphatase PrpC